MDYSKNLTIWNDSFESIDNLAGILTPENLEWPLRFKISVGLLYSITFLMAVVLNVFVIIVLGCISRTRSDLTVFLINLAVADFGMALSFFPFKFCRQVFRRWIFGGVFCTIDGGLQIWFVGLSAFTNVAIGIDRYWAILHPLKPRLSKTAAIIAIFFLWLLALGFAIPAFMVTQPVKRFGILVTCMTAWPSEMFKEVYWCTRFACTFAGPTLILAFVYTRICYTLYDRRTPGNADEVRDLMQLRSKKKIIKMLIALVSCFTLCWFPLEVYKFVMHFAPHLLDVNDDNYHWMLDFKLWFEVSVHLLALGSCIINPVIFGFQNDNFRADLVRLITCRIKYHSVVTTHRQSSTARSTKSSTNSSTRSRERSLGRCEGSETFLSKKTSVQTQAGNKPFVDRRQKGCMKYL